MGPSLKLALEWWAEVLREASAIASTESRATPLARRTSVSSVLGL